LRRCSGGREASGHRILERYGFVQVLPSVADGKVGRMFLGIATIADALRRP
jgi:hypothetical protein